MGNLRKKRNFLEFRERIYILQALYIKINKNSRSTSNIADIFENASKAFILPLVRLFYSINSPFTCSSPTRYINVYGS